MNTNWFLCKIRYEKIAENGMQKKVTEAYLVDALSYTEAESRIIEEVTSFISGEFSIAGITKTCFNELFGSDNLADGSWFKCKLNFITLDEKSGAEKKTPYQVLVFAADFRDALSRLDKGMESSMADYTIASISETPIIDVFPYHSEVKPETKKEE